MHNEDIRVCDVMTKEVVGCRRADTLATVAATLARRHLHAVFVLDDAGHPCGVVSDFDLLAGEWMARDADSLRTMQAMTAGELMTSPIETIETDAPVAEAAKRMSEQRISRLLVIDERSAPVGVVSVSDLVAPLGRPSGERRNIGDVMSFAIVTCLPSTSVEAAARAMTERRSRSVVVVNERGRAVGVITGTDLLSLYEPGNPETVADLMSTPIVTCDRDLALGDAAELMIRHEVHRLVVIDSSGSDGVPIGIVSTTDIVAEMAQDNSVWQASRA
jgi:CBS domain-containing protein